MMLASGAEPVGTVMNPPASMMRSNGDRSTMRSFTIGKASARHGSTVIVAPSVNLRMWSWQVAVPPSGPWAWPSIISEHVPQMPSRQSWSKVIGLLALVVELLVELVEHLEERRLVGHPCELVGLEAAGVGRPVLAPHLEGDLEALHRYL